MLTCRLHVAVARQTQTDSDQDFVDDGDGDDVVIADWMIFDLLCSMK